MCTVAPAMRVALHAEARNQTDELLVLLGEDVFARAADGDDPGFCAHAKS